MTVIGFIKKKKKKKKKKLCKWNGQYGYEHLHIGDWLHSLTTIWC